MISGGGVRAAAVATLLAVLATAGTASAAEFRPATGPSDSEGPRIETATSGETIYYNAEKKAKFSYRIEHTEPVSVRIDVIRDSDGAIIETWKPPPVESDEVQDVKWDGVADDRVTREGRYRFRLTARDDDGLESASADPEDRSRDDFEFYRHFFPIRGRHDYGSTGSRFGAGRSGHSHQGQDVFAECGTDLVAARGGRVQTRQYHYAAGHYLVIDGKKADEDYAYMHLKKESPRKPGERIHTGQRLGAVGESGNAQGCHLHFELWSAPGWYEGGSPYDPLPSLKHWDSFS